MNFRRCDADFKCRMNVVLDAGRTDQYRSGFCGTVRGPNQPLNILARLVEKEYLNKEKETKFFVLQLLVKSGFTYQEYQVKFVIVIKNLLAGWLQMNFTQADLQNLKLWFLRKSTYNK